jgi:hypothetical protein
MDGVSVKPNCERRIVRLVRFLVVEVDYSVMGMQLTVTPPTLLLFHACYYY